MKDKDLMNQDNKVQTTIVENFNKEMNSLIKISRKTKNVKVRPRKSKFITEFWEKGNKPTGLLCCQFYEAKWSNGCMYECDYCYLKGTFRWQNWKGNEQTVFSNTDRLFDEVEEFLNLETSNVLHTGEVSDSLAVPGSEVIMGKLVERFGKQDKHLLLLLTKSSNVDYLLNLKHNGRTVIGFSVNPSFVARKYEKGAATTKFRLKAARRCADAGYKIMIRVDPMIPITNWRDHYKTLFNRINELNPYGVVVGTLRAFPGLRPMMSKRLRDMLYTKEKDRRWHLEEKLRNQMYGLAFRTLKTERLGICKESGDTWARLGLKYGFRKFICNCHLQN